MKTKLSDEQKAVIRENVGRIRAEIDRAAGGREVTFLAATKTRTPEEINFATHECGIKAIGENRVQELVAKYDELDLDGVELHFIGTLQTNKVKYIIDKVKMIHSVDSVKLAAEIDRQAKKHGITMDVLIEINVGREESKSGIMPEELDEFAEAVSVFDNVRVRGIMVIGPICAQKEEYIEYFKKTYSFFLDILPKKIHNIYRPVLSMGMSDNYDVAVECGSNLVRVGTAVFGKRT